MSNTHGAIRSEKTVVLEDYNEALQNGDPSARIIEILNRDPEALKLLREFNRIARATGLSAEEYAELRKIVLMLAILGNEEAKQIIAEHVWAQARKLVGMES